MPRHAPLLLPPLPPVTPPPQPPVEDHLLDAEAVSKLLGISSRHFIKIRGGLREVRLGTAVRYRLADVRDWVAALAKAPAEPPHDAANADPSK